MTRKRQPPEPIALTILTGFLGSGKTTLLNWVLSHESFSNAIVLINEFGDVGLDHLFVETENEHMIEMSSGCLCCTIRGDLSDTLENLLRDIDNKRIKKIDRVIIETTGLADPAPIIQTLIAHPYFLKRFRLNSVVTTIDAQHGLETLERQEEAVKQLAMADVLVMTKTDLIDETSTNYDLLKSKFKAINKTAEWVKPQTDELRDAFLSMSSYSPDKNNPEIEKWLYGADYDDHHHHHHHDVNRHSDSIQSFSFTCDKSISSHNYDQFLDLLRTNFGAHLLRFKALVKIKEHEDRPVVSHGVQHVFYPPEIMESWPVDDQKTRIVCIMDGVEPKEIEALFRAFSGEIQERFQGQIYENENPLSLNRGDGLFKGDKK